MTHHGSLDAVRIPIFGVLGKGHRAALSARRVIWLAEAPAPDAVPSAPLVAASRPASRTEPAGVPSSTTGMGD